MSFLVGFFTLTFMCLYANSICRIGIVFNALPNGERKKSFKEWATEEYPELWARLQTKGYKLTIQGRKYNIERNFEA